MGVGWLIYSGLHSIWVDLGYTIFFGLLVAVWLVINELISILENLGSIGAPLPKFLLTIIKKLKTTTENKVESEDGNGNWYEGMLAGDNIHPTAKGSNVIAAKMMAVFSEIY